MVGKITCGRPRVMQRSYQSSACGPSNGLLPVVRAFTATVLRLRASSLRNGMRPSGGSITTDVRRDGRAALQPMRRRPGAVPAAATGRTLGHELLRVLRRLPLRLRQAGVELLLGDDGARAELRRALERHAQLVVGREDALQVGIAPGRAGGCWPPSETPSRHTSGRSESTRRRLLVIVAPRDRGSSGPSAGWPRRSSCRRARRRPFPPPPPR